MLVDDLNLDPLAIEANVARPVKDANQRSHNRIRNLQQWFSQMQQCADYLDKLAIGADVISLQQPRDDLHARTISITFFLGQSACR